jgi:[acyl-carrier-protein] S-malonyltransferase
MTSPVRWVDTIIKMKAEGVGLIIEIGPGKVLTGLVKRIDADIAAANLSDAADMPAVASLLVA